MYLGSLILGFSAWILPVLGIYRRKNYAVWSAALCAGSLYLQIIQNNILVNRGDWAAIEDTYPAICFAATVLVIVTAVLNVAAAVMERKKR